MRRCPGQARLPGDAAGGSEARLHGDDPGRPRPRCPRPLRPLRTRRRGERTGHSGRGWRLRAAPGARRGKAAGGAGRCRRCLSGGFSVPSPGSPRRSRPRSPARLGADATARAGSGGCGELVPGPRVPLGRCGQQRAAAGRQRRLRARRSRGPAARALLRAPAAARSAAAVVQPPHISLAQQRRGPPAAAPDAPLTPSPPSPPSPSSPPSPPRTPLAPHSPLPRFPPRPDPVSPRIPPFPRPTAPLAPRSLSPEPLPSPPRGPAPCSAAGRAPADRSEGPAVTQHPPGLGRAQAAGNIPSTAFPHCRISRAPTVSPGGAEGSPDRAPVPAGLRTLGLRGPWGHGGLSVVGWGSQQCWQVPAEHWEVSPMAVGLLV